MTDHPMRVPIDYDTHDMQDPPMTSPISERLRAASDAGQIELKFAGTADQPDHLPALLAEIDALRLALAGAEQRGDAIDTASEATIFEAGGKIHDLNAKVTTLETDLAAAVQQCLEQQKLLDEYKALHLSICAERDSATAELAAVKKRAEKAEREIAGNANEVRNGILIIDAFDKYTMQLDWGLSPYQPECWSLLDHSVNELVTRRMEQTALEARCAELEAALAPFAGIGIGTNVDYTPQIRLPREAIVKARAALALARQEGEPNA